jgi:Uncharacterized conserved protein
VTVSPELIEEHCHVTEQSFHRTEDHHPFRRIVASLVSLADAAAYHRLDASPAGSYRIDPDHSLAWFTIGHAGVAVVVGRFDKLSGSYTFNPASPAGDKADIRIPAASINTNFPLRDHDLRGPDFFNVREFPNITFVSTRYQPTGKESGQLYGKLTIHGVTRPVTFHVREIGAGLVPALPNPGVVISPAMWPPPPSSAATSAWMPMRA